MMGSPRVKDWLARNAPDLRLIEVEESTATVAEAAAAHVPSGHVAMGVSNP